MVITAVVLIALAVFLGGYLLSYVLQQKIPPKAIVFAHGAAAILGIVVLLIFALTTEKHHKHWDSLVIFSIAAIVGLYLFSRDIRHKSVPKWLAVVHGMVGLGGLAWILIHILH
jgi:peptidoglycan/LPS O-acetylase OafA/YrhL